MRTLFLSDGLRTSESEYQKKFDCPTTSKKVLMELCWERVEYSTLLQQSQGFEECLNNLLQFLDADNPITDEVAREMRALRTDFLKYLRNVFVKKRQPAATHAMVFIISE